MITDVYFSVTRLPLIVRLPVANIICWHQSLLTLFMSINSRGDQKFVNTFEDYVRFLEATNKIWLRSGKSMVVRFADLLGPGVGSPTRLSTWIL
jgi:hypothetical protein